MMVRRTAAKLIRFAPEELARIIARAHDCGLTPARFIRETALGAIPHARPHRDRDALLRVLAHIGASLDRLTREAVRSARDDLAVPLLATLEAHRAALQQLVHPETERRADAAADDREGDHWEGGQ